MTGRPTRFFVIGCGHTGTTLVSGILHINGYGSFKVSRLFENLTLNDLNRGILSGAITDDQPVKDFMAKVERRTAGRWSLKDPRLSETMPIFYRSVQAPVGIIFNFRDPGATVRSLRKEREMHEPHLSPQEMQQAAEQEYLSRTTAALEFLDEVNQSPVLFVRYDDLVEGRSRDALARFIGRPLDMSFVQPAKRRSRPIAVSGAVRDLHAELQRRYAENQHQIAETTIPIVQPKATGLTLKTQLYIQSLRVVNRWRRLLKDGRSIHAERRSL